MAHRAGDKPITAADASKQRGSRGDRCANAIGIGVAVPVVALATWLGMQPAEALTPLDSQQPELSTKSEPSDPPEVLAYASVRQRSHRLWHHARHHRRQENQEAGAHAPTSVVAATTQPQPQTVDPWFQAPDS